jgi:hypothetical protein
MTNQFQPTPKDKLNLLLALVIILVIGGSLILNFDVILSIF